MVRIETLARFGALWGDSAAQCVLFHRYPVKIFAHHHDPTSAAGPAANRERKRAALERTGTRGRAVLHDDRHFGCHWARLHEVPSSEQDLLGFWQINTKTQVYSKVHLPSTVCKMSGFAEVSDFFLPRAVLSPYDCDDEDIKAFADAIFPQVDQPEFIAAVAQVRPLPQHYRFGELRRCM